MKSLIRSNFLTAGHVVNAAPDPKRAVFHTESGKVIFPVTEAVHQKDADVAFVQVTIIAIHCHLRPPKATAFPT